MFDYYICIESEYHHVFISHSQIRVVCVLHCVMKVYNCNCGNTSGTGCDLPGTRMNMSGQPCLLFSRELTVYSQNKSSPSGCIKTNSHHNKRLHVNDATCSASYVLLTNSVRLRS